MSSYVGNAAAENSRNQYGDTYNNYYGDSQRVADEQSSRTELNRKLLTASEQGQLPRIAYLLRLGADLDYKDEQGFTAIHKAAKGGQKHAVMKLMKRGADLYARTGEGKTVFDYMPTVEKDVKHGSPLQEEGAAAQPADAAATPGLRGVDQAVTVDQPVGEGDTTTDAKSGAQQSKRAQSKAQPTQPPWTYSQVLRGEFIYQPSRDAIILRDGRQFKRPLHSPIAKFEDVSFEGSIS